MVSNPGCLFFSVSFKHYYMKHKKNKFSLGLVFRPGILEALFNIKYEPSLSKVPDISFAMNFKLKQLKFMSRINIIDKEVMFTFGLEGRFSND